MGGDTIGGGVAGRRPGPYIPHDFSIVSFGFPLVFLLFSYSFPMVFQEFFCFPMVFLHFSHGFCRKVRVISTPLRHQALPDLLDERNSPCHFGDSGCRQTVARLGWWVRAVGMVMIHIYIYIQYIYTIYIYNIYIYNIYIYIYITGWGPQDSEVALEVA